MTTYENREDCEHNGEIIPSEIYLFGHRLGKCQECGYFIYLTRYNCKCSTELKIKEK